MAEREGGRHCLECDRVVHDLARLSEREVRALGAQRGQRRICVRYSVRNDGSVHTAPRPLVPPSRLITPMAPVLVAATVALASACTVEPAVAPVVVPDPVQAAPRAARTPGAPATVPAQDGKPPSYADAFAASAHNPDAPDKDLARPEKTEDMMIMGEWE